ncbi:MAG: hypothetical protein KZQ60_09075, partial [Candidatus Thiodiazotropha sp. (ex Lucinoma aequizonata)]|nr:hypothetical protein [Candidatus Thiodiazotropha sp. (ex Lucinoma aequizonata)]MCU7898004.1 hypothetical protein [Candidatus Thiodiazotropha sp. (ex Lucinoma aequizonata)]
CQLNNVILSHRGVSPINGCFDVSQRQIIQIHRFYSIPQTPDLVITPPEQEEIKKLKTKMKRLEMEKEILKKSDGILCSRNEVKYSFITQHENTCPISLQCQILGVKRSAYYSVYISPDKP